MGLSLEKMLLILIIAAFVIGPERLPYYAAKLGELVRTVRRTVNNTKNQLQDELGEDFDWKQYDPRQYDPRRIIREAIIEDAAAEAAEKEAALGKERAASLPRITQRAADGTAVVAASTTAHLANSLHEAGAAAWVPFDSEAT
ncbi:twin-arginine translocase TatA/TatE family subunit [Canibacter oris]|uniref:Sec-independent protein translocase protein TatB n=1 Tax=Canibacter oris TaxID=1365628 RepID=A0A840DKV4_9MICO|nr:twin-arginine translocase TatA/TatE family subunit [Canibacter oris]MBB4070728.1 sec-independent protein translocase protein TatB [Canibacter oris]